MNYENEITFTMENNKAANTALKVMRKVLNTGDYSKGYSENTATELANDLYVEGNKVLADDMKGYFTPVDIMQVVEDLLKAVAANENIHEFECESLNDSTYDESRIEATYKDGILKRKETYYPSGWLEFLCCDECGEEFVSIEDFTPNKEYVCPECGAVMFLDEQYESVAPVVEEKEFIIQ